MSAFLGPIHYLMFSKIKHQDELCLFLTEKAEQKAPGFGRQIKEHTYAVPAGDLAEIVDPNNIHGSLQEMVQRIERKLAYIAAQAQAKQVFSLPEIIAYAKEYGRTCAVPEKLSAQEACRFLFGKLLNGMPCDRVQEMVAETETSVTWRDLVDIHGGFWQEQGLDSRQFYQIRSGMIAGMLAGSGVAFKEEKPGYYTLQEE